MGLCEPRTRTQLFEGLAHVDADYMVLDLGAGVEATLLDAFLGSDVALYVTVPEPASVEYTYRFLRALFFLGDIRGNDEIPLLAHFRKVPPGAV